MNIFSRRDFLKGVVGASVFSCLPRVMWGSEKKGVLVSIYHTTDLHGHILPTTSYGGIKNVGGLARCATQIRKWQKENPNSLLLDIGDLYQGTDVSMNNQGKLMVDCLNMMNYDGWVIGNHEFDWGIEPFQEALMRSAMPVLSCNLKLEGKSSGEIKDTLNPFHRVAPFLIKEVGGFKIAVIGVTTPGLEFWFPPEFLKGIEAQEPIEPVRKAIRKAKADGADVIVLTGHMGIRKRGDDFANRVETILEEFPSITIFIGGHTHQNHSFEKFSGIPYTQANYYGLDVGRVDIVLDPETRKIMRLSSYTKSMDDSVALDPSILSLAKKDLEKAKITLSQKVGVLEKTLSCKTRPGNPSPIEKLIGHSISEGLEERGVKVDGVFHGIFDRKDFEAGEKTVADLWEVIPYENYIVTGEFSYEELRAIMKESFRQPYGRKKNLMGMDVEIEGRGSRVKVLEIREKSGKALDSKSR